MTHEVIDKRLVLRYDRGQSTFRQFDHGADYAQLLDLARAINLFQADAANQVLLVTATKYVV